MSNPEVILQKRLKFREESVELEPGKSLQFSRPKENDFYTLARGIGVEACVKYATGWQGFTEADCLPSGGTDAVEFNADLWRDLVEDRIDWTQKVSNAIADAIGRHAAERKAASGN